NEDVRNCCDAPSLGEFAGDEIALVILRPVDVILGDKILQPLQSALGFGLVEADADELHALALVLGVKLLVLRHLRDARATPRRPEIDDHDLALEVFLNVDALAADRVGEAELEGLADYLLGLGLLL